MTEEYSAKKLHRIDLHNKKTGHALYLIIPARDAFELMCVLDGLLFGPDGEYCLDGIRIVDSI